MASASLHNTLSQAAPALGSAELHQLLVQWNDTNLDFQRDACIHQLFDMQVEHGPDAIAVTCAGQQLSYSELDRRANQLAHHLRTLGIQPDMLVGMCMERSLDMIVGMLGVLKAGGAYLPLDPEYPAQRLAYMLQDSATSVVLTQSRLRDQLPPHGARPVYLDADWPVIARMPPARPANVTDALHLAYCIYTSGSTGRPKGVLVPHRGVVRLATGSGLHYGPDEVFLQSSSIAFDASAWEIWAALLNGARLVLMPPERISPAEIGRTVRSCGVTTLGLTTGLFQQVMDTCVPDLSGVRRMVVGGDAMPVASARRVIAELPNCVLINGYGPTENTTATCYYALTDASALSASVPIGRPIANADVYVLDAEQRPVPVGYAGELYTGGDGLARGYLNLPVLTARTFIAHPFRDGQRLYRTGDLVRYRADGNLEFLGRLDDQVKIRGVRIEPGEIETVLATHPALRAATIVARSDAAGRKRLLAYIVANGAPPSVSELRAHLSSSLPAAMQPESFIAISALPLTPNGKIDKAALPDPGNGRPDLAVPYAPPHTQAECVLAQIWAEVLELNPIGLHDNFFELGGHSLRATQIAARIREQFGIDLDVVDVFAHPTIAALARHTQSATHLQMAAIVPTPRDQPLPLSLSQERVWFLQKLNPHLRAYHCQARFRLSGPLHHAALQQALSEIVRRHEILRTTFHADEQGPVQRIQAPWAVQIDVVVLTDASELESRIQTEIARDFDIAQLPLARWTLFRLGPQEHVLLHVEHHFIHDGWSFSIFLRELHALYEAYAQGRNAPLPALVVQYADYACWQRAWQDSDEALRQLAYWREKLTGAPPLLALPADRPRPSVQSFRGASCRLELSAALADGMRRLCRHEGVTLFMGLFAAFAVLLFRLTRNEDFCVGSGVANRRLRESENIIGMIVNTIALRADLSGNPDFRDMLRRMQRLTLEAYAHQELPFDRVVSALAPERSLSYSPICQTFFSFHDAPMPPSNWAGMDVDVTEALSNGTAKFDLNVVVIPRAEQHLRTTDGLHGAIAMVWEYNSDLFDESTVRRFFSHYQTLLAAALADPVCPIRNLPCMDDAQRRQLLVQWNNTVHPFPQSGVHEQVENQAARDPQATAVVFGGQRLSYGELDRRANRLAHYLRKSGVGPDTLVAVCTEPSLETVVALLGVLKAGGAYVPLDPALPCERLRFMLTDTAAPVLLTLAHLQSRLPATDASVFLLDHDWSGLAQYPETQPTQCTLPDNLAYCIYTSGTSGLPKAVLVSVSALANLIAWHGHAFSISPDDRIMQCANLAFDASAWEIWGTLCHGAALYPINASEQAPDAMLDFIAGHAISLTFLPTPVFELLAASVSTCPPSLRLILVGGDHLRTTPGWQVPRVVNAYGPTEAAVVATACELSGTATPAPIGRPIDNTHVYLLGDDLELAPVGVSGGMFVAGAGLARGYLNRPALTAEKFIPDPFGQPGSRMYQCGDLAHYRSDGNIEFLGRIDQQVKIRGFRIELGEIESVLLTCDGVREAVVTVREDTRGDKRLVAYVVTQSQSTNATELWRERLQRSLPAYMVPAAFICLSALPLNRNGKLDRQALPAPHLAAREAAYVAPGTPIQQQLATLWCELLGNGPVGIHDDFFASGGHSLIAMQLMSRLSRIFGIELPLRSLFEAPTIAQLSQYLLRALERTQPDDVGDVLMQIERMSDEEARALLASGSATEQLTTP